MTDSIRVTLVDNQPTLQLPIDLAEQLHVQSGGELHVVSTEGGIVLIPAETEIQEQGIVLEKIMNSRREALKRLAE